MKLLDKAQKLKISNKILRALLDHQLEAGTIKIEVNVVKTTGEVKPIKIEQ